MTIVRDFPLLFEEDPEVYLDRQNRIKRTLDELTSKKGIVVADWTARMKALQEEVPPVPLVVGVRYRVRLLGGELVTKHRHFRGDQGEELAVDLPGVDRPEFQEIEGIFRGRQSFHSMAGAAIILDVGGVAAMFHDADILRLEEMRP